MRGLRWQALSELFCWYCHPENKQTSWITLAMIISCSQQDDGTHSHHVTEFVWSSWKLWPNNQITTHRSPPPNHWWEINSLTGFLSCNLLFFHFSPHKNDIWTFLVIAWRKLRCRKSSQCRSAVVIVVPLFFRESHWSPTNVKVIYHRIHWLEMTRALTYILGWVVPSIFFVRLADVIHFDIICPACARYRHMSCAQSMQLREFAPPNGPGSTAVGPTERSRMSFWALLEKRLRSWNRKHPIIPSQPFALLILLIQMPSPFFEA